MASLFYGGVKSKLSSHLQKALGTVTVIEPLVIQEKGFFSGEKDFKSSWWQKDDLGTTFPPTCANWPQTDKKSDFSYLVPRQKTASEEHPIRSPLMS